MASSSRPRFTEREKGKAVVSDDIDLEPTTLCINPSYGAVMVAGAAFCRHCSCDICSQFDVNKDPSLWITCELDWRPFDSCHKHFHIECEIKSGCMGVYHTGRFCWRDATFWCGCCGNVSDILGCWRTQLILARDARCLKELCYRVSLSYRLLDRTLMYGRFHRLVEAAKKALEMELGHPIDHVSNAVEQQDIVCRDSVVQIVRNLCNATVDLAVGSGWALQPGDRGL